ncbi:hypothetical protein R1sor_025749 [Riccia sorocarpa]|uniref:Uncharacterized protein n=1 Tax=Riccia sorocarpa TaxID=122646 RepID=A0ABD3GAV5_9MARC
MPKKGETGERTRVASYGGAVRLGFESRLNRFNMERDQVIRVMSKADDGDVMTRGEVYSRRRETKGEGTVGVMMMLAARGATMMLAEGEGKTGEENVCRRKHDDATKGETDAGAARMWMC